MPNDSDLLDFVHWITLLQMLHSDVANLSALVLVVELSTHLANQSVGLKHY